MFQGCNQNDDMPPIEEVVTVKITNFETSYDAVQISWDLDRFSNDVIIENITILRSSEDEDSSTWGPQELKTVASNQTYFVDNEIPYLRDLTYFIRIDYFVEYDDGVEYSSVESEKKVYERDIIKFSTMPRHIIADIADQDSYHIMTVDQNLNLYRYNTKTSKIEANKSFDEGYDFYDKIVPHQNTLFIGKKDGMLYGLSTTDYLGDVSYTLPVADDLRYFGFNEEEIYFSDDKNWKYFNTITQNSGYVTIDASVSYAYSVNLEHNRMFMLWYQYPNFGGVIYDVSTYNHLEMIHRTDFPIDYGGRLDKGILHFKSDNSQFVSTSLGRFISMDDLSLKIELKDITGKDYLFFNYKEGKLYAAVQGERKIHVFDDTTYQLLDTIDTKLFPFYPLGSTDGKQQLLGSYQKILYSGYTDGFRYSGNAKNFAIEIF